MEGSSEPGTGFVIHSFMDRQIPQGFGTLAKAIGSLVVIALLLAGLLTGVWLLFLGAVVVGIGLIWAGAFRKQPAAHR
jgi:hypothetical protein